MERARIVDGDLSSIAGQVACRRAARLGRGPCRWRTAQSSVRRRKCGPNPTDRARSGSKLNIMTDRRGTPRAVLVSSASRHDVNFMLPLVFCAFPKVGGAPGRPPQTPKVVRADAGYTSRYLLRVLTSCGIRAEIPPNAAKRTQPVAANSAGQTNERSPGSSSTAESASDANAMPLPFKPSSSSLALSSPINNLRGYSSDHTP